ncbi:hypothetical protein [Streptomyces sp. NBC_01497]|uniref:hypothetical protein n=1 Tax=Streptomyces sp. NBC_01497 TaxID=2903885 RepID=UPI003FCE7962
MRVLLATTAGWGHFLPLLPFAHALLEAGHEVKVAAPGSFAASVRSRGLEYLPCDDLDPAELDGLTSGPNTGQLRAAHVFANLGPRAMLPGLLGAMDSWRPDLVLRDVAEIGSLVAAAIRSIPQVQVLFGLASTLDMSPPWSR